MYSHTTLKAKRHIDFILINKSAAPAIYNYLIYDYSLNLSDHLAVCLHLNLDWLQLNGRLLENGTQAAVTDKENNLMGGLWWDHSNLTQYYENTRVNISPILDNIDLYLASVSFDGVSHYHDSNVVCGECNIQRDNAIGYIDDWYSLLVDALSTSTEYCVPMIRRNTLKYWWSQ